VASARQTTTSNKRQPVANTRKVRVAMAR